MIIVSQDKKEIINFYNLVSVYVIESYEAKEKGLKKYNIDFATTDDINFVIGTYETEERAKEVLKDIISRYEAIELFKMNSSEKEGYTLSDYTPIYEMPEE